MVVLVLTLQKLFHPQGYAYSALFCVCIDCDKEKGVCVCTSVHHCILFSTVSIHILYIHTCTSR